MTTKSSWLFSPVSGFHGLHDSRFNDAPPCFIPEAIYSAFQFRNKFGLSVHVSGFLCGWWNRRHYPSHLSLFCPHGALNRLQKTPHETGRNIGLFLFLFILLQVTRQILLNFAIISSIASHRIVQQASPGRPLAMRPKVVIAAFLFTLFPSSTSIPFIGNNLNALNTRAPMDAKSVIIQMFGWNWDSIAAECTNFIGSAGYGFVQGKILPFRSQRRHWCVLC